ncbi:MAG: hybrid sensor histidine kinase/response regulator [Cyanobacteria bacterium P01_A01_bin.123]
MAKVLIIDDQPIARELTADILTDSGFTVIQAAGGQEAIAIAKARQPDLILCDIAMPGLSGYEVLTAIRENPALALTPFIFLTARTSQQDQRRGMVLGADDYLMKPFTADELIQVLKVRLERKTSAQAFSDQKLIDLRNTLTLSLPHELKTPLHGIIGFTQLLKLAPIATDPAEVVEIADYILTSAERLESLIENFLLYGQLTNLLPDSAKLDTLQTAEAILLNQMLKHVISQKAAQYQRRADVRLIVSPESTFIGNYFSIAKLAEELIDNGFKFSEPGTPVKVEAEVDPADGFKLQVSNHGRGMTPEEIAAVGAYRQFNRELYEQQGMGIGLAIVKQLVVLQQGTIDIQSRPGEFVQVTVKLPQRSTTNAQQL